MSFESEIKELRKKRIEEGVKPRKLTDTVMTDIAPLREKEDTSGLFKAGTLDDDFISLRDALALGGTATLGDISAGILQGVGGLVEGVTDLGAYGVAGILHATGNHSAAWDVKNLAKEDTVAGFMNDLREKSGISEYSFLGDFGYDVASGVGYITGLAAGGALAKAVGVTGKGLSAVSKIIMGLSGMGSGMSEAYSNGATDGEATAYGAMSAGAEVLSEMMFSGLGSAFQKLGVGTGLIDLDDVITKKLTKNITNNAVKNLLQLGIKASGEGIEEVVSGFLSSLAKKTTYKSEEDYGKILADEDLLKQAFSGFLVSLISQSGDVMSSTSQGREFVTGLTDNEQKVVDKVYENRVTEAEKDGKLTTKDKNRIYDEVVEDLKEGGIDIDTIEEVLGGETYKNYKNTVDSEDALKKELDSLRQMKKSDMNDIQSERLEELKGMNLSDTSKRNDLKTQLGKEVYDLAKDGYLAESYSERARRGEKFTADLTKYKGKQAEIVQKAIDGGFLNNTRKTHALVDLIAKVGGDKDIDFDFTNNEKLKNSGFAIDGKIINGYVTKDGVTVNVNSKKALNSVVGHEITHVLEGTELYNELRNAVYEYSKTKGDYDSRRANIENLYNDMKGADIDAELTADLVGDYLFTDTDFVRSLSTKNRSLFEKLFDEIKYLCKIATAGSKEARQLEAVKKAFQEAYRESGKSTRDDTNSLKQTGENATEQPTEVNLSEKLSPEDAQAMNIMASNIVKAAKATGLSLDDYYKATENINAFNPTRADANAIADALEEYVEVMDKDVYRGYLEKIREFGGGNELFESNDVSYSLGEIIGESGENYGIGVHLDSTLLTNLTDEERIEMVKEYVKELGGSVFTAYDGNQNPVNIHLVESNKKFKNKSGKKVPVNKDLTGYLNNKVKQESIALIDELITASSFIGIEQAHHPHDWVDNNGLNDWDVWTTYLQDKENTVWKANLRIANSSNGDKILYEIYPIEMVEQSGTSDTSSTNDIIPQTEEKVNTFEEKNQKKSLSFEDEAPTRIRGGIYGEDVLLEEAPMKQTVVEDVAPINSNVTNTNVSKTSKQSTKDAVKEIYAKNGWGDISRIVVDEDTGHAVDIGGLVDGVFTQWDMGEGIKGNAIYDLLDKRAVYEDGELTNEDELHSIIEEKLKEVAPVYNSSLPAFAHNQFEFYKNAIAEERAKAKNNRKPSISEVKRLASTKSNRKEAHGVLTSDGKQYWSNNAFFVVESNNPDTTVTENESLAVDRFKDILKKANDNVSETKYKIDPIDISLVRKKAPKGMSIVAVGDAMFDVRYVDAVLKAIEKPEVQLTTLSNTLDALLIKGSNGQALVVGINPNANVRSANFVYKADEVTVPQTDIAPVKETVSEETPIAPIRSNVETETVAPAAVNEPPIITTKQKIAAQVKASQTELEKNIQARKDSSDFYDKEIAHAQSLLDGKKNKNTKSAQALVRRIERLTRLKSSEDANFQKRINDIKSRIERLNDKSLSNHDRADRLESFKRRSEAKLEAEKNVLAQEFEQKRSKLQKEIADKNSYISKRASELYNEISNLKKGVRASKELGYLLDHGYEWKSIKTALLNTKNRPGQRVDFNSVAESTVREMLNEEYEGKVYELDELDAEYNDEVAKLETEAEKELEAFKVANQRNVKQQEYSVLMENLVGDTSTWVDKKLGLQYKTNTLRRNLRDIVRDENGNKDIEKADAIYDELQGNYNHNEASLNRETNQIKKPYAEMKFTKAEDAYIQMLGEFRNNPDTSLTKDVVEEFYNKHKDSIDVVKVDKAIDMARETYDSLLERVNEVLREQGMKEIPYRKGYFPHFTEDKQSWLAKLLNWKTQNNDIPTDIAGLTEQFNPNRSWQSFNKQRKTDTTDYSFSKGLDTYVQGSLDWIYHIEDIQKRRALENYIRYSHSEQGVKDKIDAIRQNDQYDADEMQEQIDLVYKNANNPLNNFVSDLRAGTNRLANKKSSLDRGMEEMVNRKVYSTITNLSNRVTANMVGGSISSALTNFIPITQSWGQVSPVSSLRAMGETIRSAFKNDGVVDKSDFLTNRLNTAENLYKTTWDKIGEKVSFLMDVVDNFTAQTVWRSKYLENINNGMSENTAIKDADQFAENVMAGRSRGNNPTIFDSKNPLIKTLTAFQLEVSNQYGYMLKDMPTDMRNETKAKLIKGYATMFIGAYVYNALYSSLTGRDAALDPIGIIEELLGDLFDDDEEETDAILNLVDNVVEEVPFVGGLMGGGRIPISSAMPYDGDLMKSLKGALDIFTLKDDGEATREWLKPVIYLGLPMGGGQIKKTLEGLSMFSDDHPIAGSYTDSGNLRFPVEDTIGNRIQAGIFGQWANKNAQTYLDEGYAPLDEKLVQEYKDVGMPINDYWEYRRGLNKYSTLAEKADYINSLNLTTEQKNILINNLSDRKEPIDMTNYGNYGSFDEFDFATKNPGKYTVSKVVGGYEAYKQYLSDLNNIKSDKDKYGNSITNSRKTKVIEYINGLDISYEDKIILYKSEYKSDDSFNYEIVKYLNSREDLSYNDIKSILTELGFHVDSKGNISWD